MSDRPPATLADRINDLFATHNPPGERPPTLEAVCKAINEQGATSLSIGYLSELRRGEVTNPRMDTLKALADYFHVSVSYFFDDEPESKAELRLLRAMREKNVTDLALKASELDQETLEHIASIIERLEPPSQSPAP